MDLLFSATKLRKEMNDGKLRVRRYGQRRSDLLVRRLDELRAAEVPEDLRSLPGPRCHELKADRAGRLSIDLDHPYRLIFEPEHNPIPRTPDGGLDWSQVTAVMILEVIDTHG